MAWGKRVRPCAWTERDRQDLRRLLDTAGDREEFDRRVDTELRERPKRGRKRGRSKNDFFTDFSVSEGPAKGLYLVRFRMGGATPLVCAIVSPKKRWVKELELSEQHPFAPGKKIKIEILTPHQTFREIVERLCKLPEVVDRDTDLTPAERKAWKLEAWKFRRRLGATEDAITRRLTSEFRQKVKVRK
jgi:hypothetical protein